MKKSIIKSMAEGIEERAVRASKAEREELAVFLHDPSPVVIKALLANRNITEQEVVLVAGRRNIPGDILEMIAKDKRWSESYAVKLALAKNPKTPLFAALSVARYLRFFDLADICSNNSLPIVYRKKVEAVVIEKIPTMPLGIKRTLAKTAAGEVLSAMLQDGDVEVVRSCLDNPRMVEAYIFKLITRKDASPITVRMIAGHPRWSCRYTIKLALVRNDHTPLAQSVRFFQDMKSQDLIELYKDPTVPITVKPYIHSEIKGRGLDAESAGDEEGKVYTLEDIDTEEGPAETEQGPSA